MKTDSFGVQEMSGLNDFSLQASLAFAAYADLDIGRPDVQTFRAEDFAEKQAEDFSARWTVIDQYIDASGASATVFEEVDGGQPTLSGHPWC